MKNDNLVRYMFGYNISVGTATVNEEQAAVVKELFVKFIKGVNLRQLARDLNESKVASARDGEWDRERIKFMLSNERYVTGLLDAPGIIDAHTFEEAQKIFEQNKTNNGQTVLTGRIKCGICGSNYTQVLNHGKRLWSCPVYKNKGKAFCDSKRIHNDVLTELVAEVLGNDSFTQEELDEKIALIQMGDSTVLFKTTNGEEIIKEWSVPTRSESWTPEMREAARARNTQSK